MKINKKIVVPVLASAAGLALLGGISGSVAWYQYNSRVTASLIGTSVANSGLLQISSTGENNSWGRDITSSATGSTNQNKLLPVTFGAMQDSVNGPVLPATAHGQPESAGKAGYDGFKVAVKGYEYVQYDIYLRALKVSGDNETELAAKDVYLSDMVLEDATENKLASDALRVHLNVDGGKKFLISKTAIQEDLSDTDHPNYGLPMFGKLDLDGDGHNDTVGGYEWTANRANEVTYGVEGTYQTTTGMAQMIVDRDSDTEGNIVKGAGQSDDDFANCKICTTPTTGSQKITVTVWLEGWHQYESSAIWKAVKTAGATVHVGMTFDVGRNAFNS